MRRRAGEHAVTAMAATAQVAASRMRNMTTPVGGKIERGPGGAGQLAGACGWLARLARAATAVSASVIRLTASPASAPALLTAIAISAETTLTALAARAAGAPQGRQRQHAVDSGEAEQSEQRCEHADRRGIAVAAQRRADVHQRDEREGCRQRSSELPSWGLLYRASGRCREQRCRNRPSGHVPVPRVGGHAGFPARGRVSRTGGNAGRCAGAPIVAHALSP